LLLSHPQRIGLMSKYETDTYILTTFDERGTRIDQIKITCGGLLASKEKGFSLIQEGQCASFNIHRNLFNSMDMNTSWGSK
jgi:hypothetical protein